MPRFEKIMAKIRSRQDVDRLVNKVAAQLDMPDRPRVQRQRPRNAGYARRVTPKAIRRKRRKAQRQARRRNRAT